MAISVPAHLKRQAREQGLSRRGFLELGGFLALCSLFDEPLLPELSAYAPEFRDLRARWQTVVDPYPSTRSGIAVMNLHTGRRASVNGQAVHPPGCSLNLAVVIRAAQDLQAGRYPESEVAATMLNTVAYSNPTLAYELVVRIGGGDVYAGIAEVRALLAAIELEDTVYDHPPAYLWQLSENGDPNETTADDMVKLLGALWNQELLDAQWTRYVLSIMTRVSAGLNYLIPAGVPDDPEILVGHKNGWFETAAGRPYVDNDIGIVWKDTGDVRYAYAIALLFERVEGSPHIWMAQSISRAAWEHFDQQLLSPELELVCF